MINLFIGLAIADIEKVHENATVTQRQLQIALYFICGSPCFIFAPLPVNKKFIIVTPRFSTVGLNGSAAGFAGKITDWPWVAGYVL